MKKINLEISGLIREIGIKTKNNADSNLLGTGLNSKQAKMIGYIYKHQEEGVIQNDLAKKFNKTKASITSMLQGLERKGYIKRVINEENERQKKIYVLDKGIALVAEFKNVFDNIEIQMYSTLTEDESKTLKDLLDKVNKNL
ncbi:MarR family transcriptional regulator [uncultured Clostridium sp.]|uniref:MarR family winged helix-turn-helix transcriptional regulator n=1 Tax=uncultured Clostridium sp. TaxID=59620 RepID=UPI00263014B8|nr:MarR family transcriptional regulator [uncultured Clostridium sp.]